MYTSPLGQTYQLPSSFLSYVGQEFPLISNSLGAHRVSISHSPKHHFEHINIIRTWFHIDPLYIKMGFTQINASKCHFYYVIFQLITSMFGRFF